MTCLIIHPEMAYTLGKRISLEITKDLLKTKNNRSDKALL